jgi:hypothetical protein
MLGVIIIIVDVVMIIISTLVETLVIKPFMGGLLTSLLGSLCFFGSGPDGRDL